MEGDSVVVTEDSLFVMGTARILALQNVMYFIVRTELIEVLELLNLSCIVTKNLVKKQITILEPTNVDGNDSYTFFKKGIIRKQQFCSDRNTRYQNVGLRNECCFILNDFELHLIVRLKTLYELLGLIFIPHKTDRNRTMAVVCNQTKCHGSGNIAQSNH